MEKHIFEGKDIESIKEQIKDNLNVNENEYLIKVSEEKAGLFKGKKIVAEVITKKEIVEEAKALLKNIISLMGIEANMESKIRDEQITINIFSDNNPILIGKNGRTLDSLQIVLRQALATKLGDSVAIILDVEGYKNKKIRNIEYLAKKTANEVLRTKVEAKLMNMNSFERRAVHAAIADFKGVYTESVGEEPNRAVIIKPKDV